MAKVAFQTTYDKNLLKEVKMLALKEDKNVNDVIEEALREFLKSKGITVSQND